MSIGTEAAADFLLILSELKRTVTYKSVSLDRNNITGDDIPTYPTSASKDWIFWKRGQKFMFDKEGVIELGDAYIMIPPTDTVVVRDRVVADGETYEITATGEKLVRHFNGATVYIYCVLRKVAGDQT